MIPFVLLAPLVVDGGSPAPGPYPDERPTVAGALEHTPPLKVPYGNPGSLEASAWAGIAAATGSVQGEAGGTFGWFFLRGLEVSAIAALAYVHPQGSELVASLLAEPSVHMLFGESLMGFAGLGGGATLSSMGFGFAVAPRLGVNVLFGQAGRTGVLTPAIGMTYATNAPAVTALAATVGYGLAW
jgi:hypothetical protein